MLGHSPPHSDQELRERGGRQPNSTQTLSASKQSLGGERGLRRVRGHPDRNSGALPFLEARRRARIREGKGLLICAPQVKFAKLGKHREKHMKKKKNPTKNSVSWGWGEAHSSRQHPIAVALWPSTATQFFGNSTSIPEEREKTPRREANMTPGSEQCQHVHRCVESELTEHPELEGSHKDQ